MRRWKYIVSFFLFVTLLLGAGTVVSASDMIANEEKFDSGLYEIMGTSSVTIGQMVNYFQNNTLGAKYPSFYENTEAPTIYAFAQIYMEECQAEGVRAEVAFAQCMHETGYLTYPGDATPDQFNFAGLDTWGVQPDGTVVKGRAYPSLRIGIRAHVQRLRAWAVKGTVPSSFKNPCVDANKFDSKWWRDTCVGSAPYVQWLEKENNPNGYGWATDPQYTEKVVRHLNLCLSASRYTTWYNGVDYGAIFSPDYYLGHYGDVAKAYSGREEEAIAHFVNYGMKEGRQGSAAFDVYSYKRQYADLRGAYGNNLKSYYLHFMNYGKREGRKGTGCTTLQGGVTKLNGVDYSAVYNYSYYVSANSDIKRAYGDDDIATLNHFVNYGMREGRQASSNFNVVSYLNRYSDLRRAYGNNLPSYYKHYMNYGRREGRVGTGTSVLQGAQTVFNGLDYSAVYDYNYYISKYPEVKRNFGYDDYKILQYFVNTGMREGHQASGKFEVKSYYNRYADLRKAYGTNWQLYYTHYIRYGKKEGRVALNCSSLQNPTTVYNGVNYVEIYDYNYYISRNQDVARAFGGDENKTLQHFVNYGMREGRQASANFNVQVYANRYGDLRNAYGNNLQMYYLHYLNYGIREGRSGK